MHVRCDIREQWDIYLPYTVYGEISVVKIIFCVKFSLHLIFVGQATWLLFIALITSRRQIFVCLILVCQAVHENCLSRKFIRPL